MRIAVLVKQVPKFEEMQLGPDGRLRRDGIELEMNPYCRRAVSKGVELGSSVTVITLGPPSAEDVLREAIAWGLARDVDTNGLLITDPAFAGSDTIATARVLATVLEREGPFDLVLLGRNSVDADTGQVGPQIAELLDLPFLTGVRYLSIEDDCVHARCEHDDGWMQAEAALPAVLSCAERLCDPAKVDPPERALVSADRIRTITAQTVAPAASKTVVGEVKMIASARAMEMWPDAPLDEQIAKAVALLRARGALDESDRRPEATVPAARDDLCLVLCEPDRDRITSELLGGAQRLTSNVLAITFDATTVVEEDVANAAAPLAANAAIVLAPSTAWGREVASRLAAKLDAGLVGDAVDLEMMDDRLVAWKPAFGGQLVAAITCTSPVQIATVRPGVLPTSVEPAIEEKITLHPRNRIEVLARTRDDDVDVLADASVVIGVGMGVPPDEFDALESLRQKLHAELGATRKVTDQGWLPRSRQIGITGRAIAPRLFVSIGASGKFNHAIGVRAAGTVLAINPDANAPIFTHADVGIVGDWQEIVPRLVAAL
jgi:electron transfer flavoprotein alpha subunit